MAKMLVALLPLLLTDAVSSQNLNNLPCVKRLNQLYCSGAGYQYPTTLIESYIDDNKQLMRRMYGSLVQEEPVMVEPQPQTPASTTFARGFHSFGGSRFSRSVDEGFLEDFLLEEERYHDLDANFTGGSNSLDGRSGEKDDEEFSFRIVYGRPGRGKRQAGFPADADTKTDKNKVDACESRTEVTTPFWATNSNGQVRAIVNSKNFEQAVHQEICSSGRTLRCAGDCSCEQKYKWHRLLAYDPNNDCNGIFMDWFLFPSCCACRCLKNPLLA